MAGVLGRWNGVKPKTKREAQIWAKWNRNDWYPIRNWPQQLAQAVISEKLTNRQRFTLALYLVGNGVEPTTAADWIHQMGGHYFDREAVNQLNWIWKNLDKLEKYTYWDEAIGRRARFSAPATHNRWAWKTPYVRPRKTQAQKEREDLEHLQRMQRENEYWDKYWEAHYKAEAAGDDLAFLQPEWRWDFVKRKHYKNPLFRDFK